MYKKSILLILLVLFLITTLNFTETNIKLEIDGKNIVEKSMPINRQNRVLVPIRFLAENLDGKVLWDSEKRIATIKRNGKKIDFKINSRMLSINDGKEFLVSDVKTMIHDDRTYVPIRIFSNALGIKVNWDGNNQKVVVDSNETFQISKNLEITNDKNINGKEEIKINLDEKYRKKGYSLKAYLLNNNFKGHIIAKSQADNIDLEYIPSYENEGKKVLAIGLYDKNDKLVTGDAKNININIEPEISYNYDFNNLRIKKFVTFQPNVNFIADYVSYFLKNLDTGEVKIIKKRDPYGSYKWEPTADENGRYEITTRAYYAGKIRATTSEKYLTIDIDKDFEEDKLRLTGVSEGQRIRKKVNLNTIRNFSVEKTFYYMKDVNTGKKTLLKELPYGSFEWKPSIGLKGKKELTVAVKDTKGNIIESDPIQVNLDIKPYIEIKGVGPNEVFTNKLELDFDSNIDLDNVKYILSNDENKYSFNHENLDKSFEKLVKDIPTDGYFNCSVKGNYKGEILESDSIRIKIYKGKTYGYKPIVKKENFLNFASEKAISSYKETNMAASLQTAQAILETGWGQSIPVDKYTGQFSYNLFGIKGKGTNGSVVSTTWEVYNGKSYTVDDYFRAYNDAEESWKDHKSILLNLNRYSIFRDVMYNSRLGAWAIRRAGYATDPRYPIKL
ncbi:MAG: stalk domain-containing protein, partial [Bacillota bacterium]